MSVFALASRVSRVEWRCASFVDRWLVFGSFPGSSAAKEYACSARDPGSIPGSGRSPGEGTGNPPQYPWTEEPGGLKSMGLQRGGHD